MASKADKFIQEYQNAVDKRQEYHDLANNLTKNLQYDLKPGLSAARFYHDPDDGLCLSLYDMRLRSRNQITLFLNWLQNMLSDHTISEMKTIKKELQSKEDCDKVDNNKQNRSENNG